MKTLSPSLRIAVIADTHDFFQDALATEITTADEIWHLGDVCRSAILEKIELIGPPVTIVKGNNDLFQPWPMEVTLERNGISFRLIHIPPARSQLGTTDILLHGHTHVPRDEVINGVRILNPGAVGKANKGAPLSYAWLTLDETGLINWRIVLL